MRKGLLAKRLLRIYGGLLSAIFCVSQSHAAPVDFGCLKGTEGKIVLWDREWQPDNSDHDVRYRVITVEDRQFPARPREAIITLQALESANIANRTTQITREPGAQLFCSRIETQNRNPVKIEPSESQRVSLSGGSNSQPFSQEAAKPSDLSYRVLSNGKWVPARATPEQARHVCQAPDAAYACNEKDYKSLATQNSKTGYTPEISKLVKLPYPFIRHTADGWVRSVPMDLLETKSLTICTVGERSYHCFKSERDQYQRELKELHEEASM